MKPATDRPWIQTVSGRAVYLDAPTPESIHIPDVIHHLSFINRFVGAAGAWSVAAHSILVAEITLTELREYAAAVNIPLSENANARAFRVALLHDAHEFATGDIAQPIKRLLQKANCPISAMERRLDNAIFPAFGMTPPTWARREYGTAPARVIDQFVKRADHIALLIERAAFLVPGKSTTPAWSPPPEGFALTSDAGRDYLHLARTIATAHPGPDKIARHFEKILWDEFTDGGLWPPVSRRRPNSNLYKPGGADALDSPL